MVYEGYGFVNVVGKHQYQISPLEVANLVASMRLKDIWSMRTLYRAPVTDCPVYTITINMNGKTHQIQDYVGSWVGMPAAITEFENEIDRVAKVDMWHHLSKDTVNLLKAEGFNFQSNAGATVLQNAIADPNSKDDEAILELMKLGARIQPSSKIERFSNMTKNSILDEALLNSRSALIDSLIENGALETNNKQSRKKINAAFHAAIEGGNFKLVKKIWDLSGNKFRPSLVFNSKTEDSVQGNKLTPVTLLLTKPMRDDVTWEAIAITKWLVTLGCDIKAVNSEGDSLLHIASRFNDRDFVKYLLDQGVDPTTPGRYQLPALASTIDEGIALLLLEAGANPYASDDEGFQFSKYAETNRWLKVLAWLRKHSH